MLLIHLRLALRNLFATHRGRLPVFALINLTGLAIGLAAFLLIVRYISYELSYDRSFPMAEQIYRVALEKRSNGETTLFSAKTYPGVGPALQDRLPEVTGYARLLFEECMFHYEPGNIRINRQKTYWADASFAGLFGLEFIRTGDLILLGQPNHAIISESAARRFFGEDWSEDQSPIGKTVHLNEHIPFVIQGIFRDLPQNTHLEVDFIVSHTTLVNLVGPRFENGMPPFPNADYTYIAIKPGSDPGQLEAQVNAVLNPLIPEAEKVNTSFHFRLQPLTGIHLESHLDDELRAGGNKRLVWAIGLAALLILVIAWVNFVNLNTARAIDRSKEIGVRKAIGAGKRQLVFQLIFESLISSTMAAFLAIMLVALSYGYFLKVSGIHSPLFASDSLGIWLLFAAVAVSGGVISGIYPALVMASIQPGKALKGTVYLPGSGSSLFRKGLITFQFIVAILLVSFSLTIYHQIRFMRTQELGMDPEQVLVLHSPRSMIGNKTRATRFDTFRESLANVPGIEVISSSGCLPGKDFLNHSEAIVRPGSGSTSNLSFDVASADENYLRALNIRLLAGRNFARDHNEEKCVILNKKAILQLGFTDANEAIDQLVSISGNEKRIIGVTEDTHYRGLQHPVNPLLLHYGHGYEFGYFEVALNTGQVQQTVATIRSQWEESYPEDPFDAFFLDNHFNQQYASDQAFGTIFGGFTLLAIFIAALGLLALSSYVARRKKKEVGIRKVLGASAESIFWLLSLGFARLVVLASVIALPVAWFLVNRWLDTFAFRFQPDVWMLCIPLAITFVAALLAISGQSIRAATANPVDALKEE